MRALVAFTIVLYCVGFAHAWQGNAERALKKQTNENEGWLYADDKGVPLPPPNQAAGAFPFATAAPPKNAFGVVIGAGLGKVAADVIVFAKKNPNLEILIVDFASLKKDGQPVKVPKDLPDNVLVHVKPLDDPASFLEDSLEDEAEKGVSPAAGPPGPPRAAAGIKAALQPALLQLKSMTTTTAKAWAQKYAPAGGWHYWGDGVAYPKHHVSICATVKCAPQSHSKEDGVKCAYFGNKGNFGKGCGKKDAAYRNTLTGVWNDCIADPICV